jgi:hypothetical protein
MLLGLGLLVQIAADALVGVRLLWLAWRTRELPELCMGLCCFLLGGVGLPLSLAIRAGLVAGPETRELWLAGALAIQDLACLALYVATWRVFRVEAEWARALVLVAGLLLAASVPSSGSDHGLFYWIGWGARGAAFLWSALESRRYLGLLRRRQALGLADPVVVDRFRLWSICCGAVVLGFLVFLGGRLLALNPAETPAVLATTSLVGLVGGLTLWLAFAPPAAYLRRVEARAARASAS